MIFKKNHAFIDVRETKINACDWYKPKRNKKKIGLLGLWVATLLITPCTNWLLVPTAKVLNKYPMWLYK